MEITVSNIGTNSIDGYSLTGNSSINVTIKANLVKPGMQSNESKVGSTS